MSDGAQITLDDLEEVVIVDAAELAGLHLAPLTQALGEWSAVEIPAQIWSIWPPGTDERTRGREPLRDVLIVYDFDARELRTVVCLDIEPDEDPAFELALPALVAPAVDRAAARVSFQPDPVQGQWLSVQVSMEPERFAGELLELALDLAALLAAAREGQVDLRSARDLVLGGHARALVGLREGGWLDAKGAPYRLEHEREAWELAKDVAAFAGVDGGLIVIPATTRLQAGVEVIDEVKDLPLSLVDEARYRDVIAARVYPVPRGVEITAVPLSPERGVLSIYIPPQPDDQKPFLVRGGVLDGRVMAQTVTVPWRDGDQTRYEDIAAIHTALRADRQRERDDIDLIEQLRLDALPPPFLVVLRAARAAGLPTDVHKSGYRIHVPNGPPVDVDVRDLHPKTTDLALHSVLERLRSHGVRSRTTSRGFRVPVDEP